MDIKDAQEDLNKAEQEHLDELKKEARGAMFCDMTQGLAEYIESVRGEKLDSNV
jgi:hypothetical protein